MSELKPCPFCGNNIKAYIRKNNPYARCETKNCKGSQLPVINLDEIVDIEKWNAREQHDKLTEQNKLLREALETLIDWNGSLSVSEKVNMDYTGKIVQYNNLCQSALKALK